MSGAGGRPRFVWVTPESVDRPRSGGALRSARLIAALAAVADVDVVVVSAAPVDTAAAKAALGVRSVEWFGRDLRGLARRRFALRRRWPLSSAGAWSEAAAAVVAGHAEQGAVVIVDHLRLAPFHVPGRPWVLSLQNVDWMLARTTTRAVEARYEEWALRRAQRAVRRDPLARVVVVSEHDRALVGGDAVVVPNGTDVPAACTSVQGARDVVFVGSMDYPPNLEAVRWWSDAVWTEGMPPLVVAGRGAGDVLGPHSAIVNLGEVDDVGPVLERARVVAVPLRSGSGTRLKVVEAMAHGRPVVTTSKGVEGIEAVDGVHVLVADDPREFAAAVRRVLADDDLAAGLAGRGRALAETLSWDAAAATLLAFLAPATLGGVGVVVVTYNSAADIGRCLGSLPIDELAGVVVVDNASTDGTADLVRREWPGVTLVALDDNLGFGAGCNRGAAAIEAEWLLFLNPDATIDAGNLGALVAYAGAHPEAGVLAPALAGMSSSGDLPTLATELRYAVPPHLARHFPERRHAPGRPTGPVDVVEGACLLVERRLFERVGRFDERFFLFFEEADLARRVRAEGRQVHLVAEAVAHHGIGASRAGTALGSRPHYLRSTVRYLRKWEGGGAATTFAALASLTFRLRSRFGSLPTEDAALLLDGVRDRRPLFVAWSRQPRSAAVAEFVGADLHTVTVGRHGQRALVPLRYTAQAAATAWQLARRRPRVVIVMCPPLALGLLVLAYAKATGAAMAVDAHTAAILRRGRVRRSIRFFDRRGCALVVAGDHIADHLAAAGLRRPSAIHNPMPALAPTTKAGSNGDVVVPLGWAPDEPVGAVLDAARRLPDLKFVLTGRPKGEWAGAELPSNVRRAGLLAKADYDELVQEAAVVVALTTRPFTMLQAGYEAVQARVPVVVSDTPTLRDYFGAAAVFAPPDGESLAAAVTDALTRTDELVDALGRLAADHGQRQGQAVAELQARLTVRGGARSPSW